MLSSLQTYGEFIYTLPQRFDSIRASTLILKPRGAMLAELSGTLEFDRDLVLRVAEEIDLERQRITTYFYSVEQTGERIYWYDPQPHPTDAALQSTHPHHKHIAPNIKRHRVPAPGLGFTQPNLPFLIQEITARLEQAAE
jgi:hypothetical protein